MTQLSTRRLIGLRNRSTVRHAWYLAVLWLSIVVVITVPLANAQNSVQPVTTIPARDIRNGWGICGIPGRDASEAAYATMLDQIGTRNIRAHLFQHGTTAAGHYEAIRRAMVQAGTANPTLHLTALVTAYLNDSMTSWPNQQNALLAFAKTGMLRAIEGPNEINNRVAGNGAHGPNDRADRTGIPDYPSNYLAWAQALAEFKRANAKALQDVALIAPSIASGMKDDYARLPAVAAFVDAGNMHFYAGSGRQPSFSTGRNPLVGYFANIENWAQSAQIPAGPVWMTEAGASTSDTNYARDGISQAKYIANQFFDYFAAGGTRLFIYQLVDGSGMPNDTEGNFGLFRHDGTPKPAAVMLGHLKNLLSLGSYDDTRNLHDEGTFTPVYDAQALRLTGLTSPDQAGQGYLIMPKSDGSTMIAVWNEPPIDDGKGRDLQPGPDPITLDFGSVQTFSVHDLLGPSPLTGTTARGTQFDTGRTVQLQLRGYPMLVELRPRQQGKE